MRIADGDLRKLLLRTGTVKETDLDALVAGRDGAAGPKEPLQTLAVKKKLISEKDLMKLYAQAIEVPFVELKEDEISKELLAKIPERIARKYQVILYGQDEAGFQLAMADPEDFQAADFIRKQVGAPVRISMAAPADIAAALDQYKGEIGTEITQAIKDSSVEAEEQQQEASAKDIADDAPIAKTVNVILEYALKSRASDIHIEPREAIVQVRYRIDGVLHETMTLPKPILPAVVSRIKILSNLKIDEHRVPQDGRFKFAVGGKTVGLRVSTLPIMDGEKVVMRILDEGTRALTLEELGFEGGALAAITRGIHKPHGLVLVTGPTGSGKSTTLYSVLSMLNVPGVNISTVEDPVEYRIQGVNQTQVNPKAGMTFAAGLRALLRQDPNIIMVGEIRDGETADLGVQAALTGHVVVSTLHTNNAATTLPRLLDMNIEPFLIASTVNTVIGQRLVRRLCPVCRVTRVPGGHELEEIRKNFQVDAALKHLSGIAEAASPQAPAPVPEPEPAPAPVAHTVPRGSKTHHDKVILPPAEIETDKSILARIAADPNIINRSAQDAKAKGQAPVAPPPVAAAPAPAKPSATKAGQLLLYGPGAGCDECNHVGYKGRMGIYEVLEVNEVISKMIVARASSDEIQVAAVKNGMLTMQQDGFIKALMGLTTVEEIMRVTRE